MKLEEAAKKTQKNLIGELAEPDQKEETRGEKKTKYRNWPRMNICFEPEGYEYLKVMAKIHGKTVTGQINFMIEQDMKRNADLYEQSKKIIDELMKREGQ